MGSAQNTPSVPSPAHGGKEDGQRHHDDRLSKQGEKGGVAGLAQSHKDTLPGKLQRHEAEAEEIDVQGGGYRSLPAAGYRENADKKCREQFQKSPLSMVYVTQAAVMKTDGLSHFVISPFAVVKAHDRGRRRW